MTCAGTVLDNVCPNCGGGFVPRPIRPSTERRPGGGLNHDPSSTQRVHLRYPKEEVAAFVAAIRDTRRRSGNARRPRRSAMDMKNPPHVGDVIQHEILEPLNLTVTAAERVLGVSRPALSRLLNGRASLSPEMAVRFE
jgi:hypothetical protein